MRDLMFFTGIPQFLRTQFLSFSLTLHFSLYLEVYYIYKYIYNNI